MSFSSLGLHADILRAVQDQGYDTPTPVQQQAIPAVLSGGDLMAGAQTGTGKTAGFTLPLLDLLMRQRPAGRPVIRALVLTPTRELAAQVEESIQAYGKYLPLTSMVMFGGVGINPQIDKLRKGVDILVATPGRLLDHVQQRTVDLRQVEILVLDEADRMLDMGFIRDIRKILALLPANRQNLLFSATFSNEIKALADGLLNNPALIEVARRNATADTIAQKVHPVDRERKRELLSKLIRDGNWFQVLVFTRTKHGANRLADQLEKDGIPAMAIHGNKSQGARTKALSEFKSGNLQVLVATDIAARGIDISELPHVVNFELPNVAEDYVHRIGRTGRAGCEGEAVSLVCVDEDKLLAGIEKLIKRSLPKEVIAGFEPDPTIKAEPIPNGRQQGPRQGDRGARRPSGQTSNTSSNTGSHRSGNRPGGNASGNSSGSVSGNTSGNASGRPSGQRNGNQPGRANAEGGGARGNRSHSGGQGAGAGRSAEQRPAGGKPPQRGRRPGAKPAGGGSRGSSGNR